MKQDVIKVINQALSNLSKEWGADNLPHAEVEFPRDESMGDFATTVAMRLTKILKKPPQKIAGDIVEEINRHHSEFFEKIEIAGPGFINFTFKKEYFQNSLKAILKEKHSTLNMNIGKGRKIQVEFVSANPTGPLHIGHGRGAAGIPGGRSSGRHHSGSQRHDQYRRRSTHNAHYRRRNSW